MRKELEKRARTFIDKEIGGLQASTIEMNALIKGLCIVFAVDERILAITEFLRRAEEQTWEDTRGDFVRLDDLKRIAEEMKK